MFFEDLQEWELACDKRVYMSLNACARLWMVDESRMLAYI